MDLTLRPEPSALFFFRAPFRYNKPQIPSLLFQGPYIENLTAVSPQLTKHHPWPGAHGCRKGPFAFVGFPLFDGPEPPKMEDVPNN